MKHQNFECCHCGHIFESTYYNWYFYYAKGKFQERPECKSKLVPSYDYQKTGMLDKVTNRLYLLAFISGAIASFFWGVEPVGIMVFMPTAIVAGVFHARYWGSLSNIDNKLQKTKFLVRKDDVVIK